MATSNSEGSQTAVITTEHTLATITTSGTFLLGVDTNALVLGDEVELRVKLMVRATGTTRQVYKATYIHNQDDLVKLSIPVASTNEVVFTLKQVAGTGRAFPWEIWEL